MKVNPARHLHEDTEAVTFGKRIKPSGIDEPTGYLSSATIVKHLLTAAIKKTTQAAVESVIESQADIKRIRDGARREAIALHNDANIILDPNDTALLTELRRVFTSGSAAEKRKWAKCLGIYNPGPQVDSNLNTSPTDAELEAGVSELKIGAALNLFDQIEAVANRASADINRKISRLADTSTGKLNTALGEYGVKELRVDLASDDEVIAPLIRAKEDAETEYAELLRGGRGFTFKSLRARATLQNNPTSPVSICESHMGRARALLLEDDGDDPPDDPLDPSDPEGAPVDPVPAPADAPVKSLDEALAQFARRHAGLVEAVGIFPANSRALTVPSNIAGLAKKSRPLVGLKVQLMGGTSTYLASLGDTKDPGVLLGALCFKLLSRYKGDPRRVPTLRADHLAVLAPVIYPGTRVEPDGSLTGSTGLAEVTRQFEDVSTGRGRVDELLKAALLAIYHLSASEKGVVGDAGGSQMRDLADLKSRAMNFYLAASAAGLGPRVEPGTSPIIRPDSGKFSPSETMRGYQMRRDVTSRAGVLSRSVPGNRMSNAIRDALSSAGSLPGRAIDAVTMGIIDIFTAGQASGDQAAMLDRVLRTQFYPEIAGSAEDAEIDLMTLDETEIERAQLIAKVKDTLPRMIKAVKGFSGDLIKRSTARLRERPTSGEATGRGRTNPIMSFCRDFDYITGRSRSSGIVKTLGLVGFGSDAMPFQAPDGTGERVWRALTSISDAEFLPREREGSKQPFTREGALYWSGVMSGPNGSQALAAVGHLYLRDIVRPMSIMLYRTIAGYRKRGLLTRDEADKFTNTVTQNFEEIMRSPIFTRGIETAIVRKATIPGSGRRLDVTVSGKAPVTQVVDAKLTAIPIKGPDDLDASITEAADAPRVVALIFTDQEAPPEAADRSPPPETPDEPTASDPTPGDAGSSGGGTSAASGDPVDDSASAASGTGAPGTDAGGKTESSPGTSIAPEFEQNLLYISRLLREIIEDDDVPEKFAQVIIKVEQRMPEGSSGSPVTIKIAGDIDLSSSDVRTALDAGRTEEAALSAAFSSDGKLPDTLSPGDDPTVSNRISAELTRSFPSNFRMGDKTLSDAVDTISRAVSNAAPGKAFSVKLTFK